MSRTRQAAAALTATLAIAFLSSACGASGAGLGGPPPSRVGAPVTYLDIADQATLAATRLGSEPGSPESAAGAAQLPLEAPGDQALPDWTVSYSALAYDPGGAGGDGQAAAPIGAAETLAARVKPSVVSVELGLGPALAGGAPASFGTELHSLLADLRHDGAVTILVANLPPVNLAPYAWLCSANNGCPAIATTAHAIAAALAAYDAVIASAASAAHATVVDVRSALLRAIARHGEAYVFGGGTEAGLTSAGARVVEAQYRSAVEHRALNRAGTGAF
jgi:hypothetical protein